MIMFSSLHKAEALLQRGLWAVVRKQQCRRLIVATAGAAEKNTVHREPMAVAQQRWRLSSGTAGIVDLHGAGGSWKNHRHWCSTAPTVVIKNRRHCGSS